MAKTTKRPKADELDDAIVAPSVRVFTEWSPSLLRAAMQSAESGNLTRAVQVCEWLLTDERVEGGLGARGDALFGLRPDFEPSGDKRRSNRAVKALEAGEDFWAAYPESELRLMHKWGLLLGVAPMRHHWQALEDHGNRLLPMPRLWHPQSLQYSFPFRRWTLRDDHHREHEVVAGDGEWILHRPFGHDRPWAHGAWRSLANWVLLKHYARLDWARHGEKASTLVSEAPEGATKEQRRELAKDLKDAGTDRIVALPPGFQLKLVEVSANTERIYKAQIDAANAAITILIRGSNLNTEIKDGTGSRAAAESQAEQNEEPKLRFDAETVTTTLHDQSLVWWAEWNFGSRSLAPWPVYPVEPEEDLQASATTIKTLGEGLETLDRLGFELDDKAIKERFRLDFVKGRTKPDPAPAPVLPGAPAPADPADPKAPKAPKPPKAKASLGIRLASGAAPSEAPGFVGGQLFADDLVETATAAAQRALEPTLEAIARAIDESDSYEDLRARLREIYPKLDQTDLQELVYRALTLGELAGRHSANQDA